MRYSSLLSRAGANALAIVLVWSASASFVAPAAMAQQVDPPPTAEARLSGAFKAPHVAGELIVKLRDGGSKRALDVSRETGLELVRTATGLPELALFRGASDPHAAAAAVALAESPNVEYVEPNYLQFADGAPNDPKFAAQWGLNTPGGVDVSAINAWDKTTGSDDVVVGIVDSGMDTKHDDLRENLFVNDGEIPNNGVDDDNNGYVDDVNGWDAITNSGKMKDEDSHGTHVSGIVGARGNNNEGIAGVMWRVKLLPLRFIGTRSGSTFDAIECIDYAVTLRNRGVNLRVLNNSWGGGPATASLRAAIERANRAGILFVCAAGNESQDGDVVPHYPSAYEVPNVVSVGAITKANAIAGFSNYGKRSVDIFAPGDQILSTVPGNGYQAFSGTSQASPCVAGIAGLVVAANPDATVGQIKARLLGAAVRESYAAPRCLTGGRINASSALRSETLAPAPLADFHVRSVSRSTLVVEWTSVGDDGASGQATYYDIRWSTAPIDAASFEGATPLSDTRVPLAAGETETALVRGCFAPDEPIFVAMRVYDKAGNVSQSATVFGEPTGEPIGYDLLSRSQPEATIGEPLGLKGDDVAMGVELPFAFPFYGATYPTAFVSSNGLVTFDVPNTSPVGSRSEIASINGIAPLWIDMRTDGKLSQNEDVYVERRGSSITFRWITELVYEASSRPKDAQPISLAVTLFADGSIDIDYGPGGSRSLRTGSYLPTVGVSDGGCANAIFEGYNTQESLANVPVIHLEPTAVSRENAPTVTIAPFPAAGEGIPLDITASAIDPLGRAVTLDAGLPRNATFDAATGTAHFTPDSAQSGPVLFTFVATSADGVKTTKPILVYVSDDPSLPEVRAVVAKKKKVTFYGVGFQAGSTLMIDGVPVGDAKGAKQSPSTRLLSAGAKAMLGGPAMHVVTVENPGGARSGPYYYWQ